MLIELRVANFRSFNEEQTISLVASKRDDAHPDNLIVGEKFNLLKAAAIYGPNASGKSNLIKAIRFMEMFILNSATKMNLGDKIPWLVPFRLEPNARGMPASFELVIIIDGTRFEYGFSSTLERVHSEFLVAYPKGRPQRWLEREFDAGTKQTTWAFRGPLKREERILKERTRDNGLALSRGAELNIEALNRVFMWFRESLWFFDLSDRPLSLMQETARRVRENKAFYKDVLQLIQHADLGIDEIVVAEEPSELKDVPEELKAIVSALTDAMTSIGASGRGLLTVKTLHHLAGLKGHEEFDIQMDESNGTQRFFALAGPFLDALAKGTVVVVDELECSMHPLLTRKLIELFQSPEANKKGAQLIFSTHDSTLMDPELFRRDQIWLVEKNRKGASQLFSLYDFDTKDRPRNTEAFQRNYLAGRYGGVPKFGPTFEDLEFK